MNPLRIISIVALMLLSTALYAKGTNKDRQKAKTLADEVAMNLLLEENEEAKTQLRSLLIELDNAIALMDAGQDVSEIINQCDVIIMRAKVNKTFVVVEALIKKMIMGDEQTKLLELLEKVKSQYGSSDTIAGLRAATFGTIGVLTQNIDLAKAALTVKTDLYIANVSQLIEQCPKISKKLGAIQKSMLTLKQKITRVTESRQLIVELFKLNTLQTEVIQTFGSAR